MRELITVDTVDTFLKENNIELRPFYKNLSEIAEYMNTAPDDYTLEDWLKDTRENYPHYLFKDNEVVVPKELKDYIESAELKWTVDHLTEYIAENHQDYLEAYKSKLTRMHMADLIIEYHEVGVGCEFEEPLSFIQHELIRSELESRLNVPADYFDLE